MKLASLKDGSRDGRLALVSRDLQHAKDASAVAPTMLAALRDWSRVAPLLRKAAEDWDEARPFDPAQAMAPLPQAPQWLDGSAYVTHVELVRRARGAEMPERFWTDPLMYQGASDNLLGPTDPILVASESYGIDLEAEVAVITDDVPMGISPDEAGAHILLLLLVNDVSLRALIPDELAKGFGFVHSKPASAFSPVAVTPDELGPAWRDGKVHLPLLSFINETSLGHPDAGTDMTFDFPTLIAHAAKTRTLSAGTIIGSGTVANRNYHDVGSSCLAERRMIETLEQGKPVTPFLKYGDHIRIEMHDPAGRTIFGAIDQQVRPTLSARKSHNEAAQAK
ncbi:MAG TPA: fumarylacetoacetate hydrolase family protein [Dongiaceae bacterium]|jgi:fumarylacetoacetate (FAA) hydrolase|nr:fumarylacetoacetate hydrolase family protein [Dongiaceae bacterium]